MKFNKSRPVAAELFHVDGQTERNMTNLIAAFRNFANVPKTVRCYSKIQRLCGGIKTRLACTAWVTPLQLFLGAFAKLRKATVNFIMSVRPFAWNSSVPTGWLFMKFDV